MGADFSKTDECLDGGASEVVAPFVRPDLMRNVLRDDDIDETDERSYDLAAQAPVWLA